MIFNVFCVRRGRTHFFFRRCPCWKSYLRVLRFKPGEEAKAFVGEKLYLYYCPMALFLLVGLVFRGRLFFVLKDAFAIRRTTSQKSKESQSVQFWESAYCTTAERLTSHCIPEMSSCQTLERDSTAKSDVAKRLQKDSRCPLTQPLGPLLHRRNFIRF